MFIRSMYMSVAPAQAICALSLLALSSQALAASQAFSIQMLGATPTQAAFSYSAPDANACTVQESTDPTFATVDHDVDPVLFPGSNSDTRSGNLVNGTYRTIVVGFRGT